MIERQGLLAFDLEIDVHKLSELRSTSRLTNTSSRKLRILQQQRKLSISFLILVWEYTIAYSASSYRIIIRSYRSLDNLEYTRLG